MRLLGECEQTDEALFAQAKIVDHDEPETEIEAAMHYLAAALIDGPRPFRPLLDEAIVEELSKRTIERARAKLKCETIPPAKLRERLSPDTYAKATDEELRMWWVALPPIPDAPPDEWGA